MKPNAILVAALCAALLCGCTGSYSLRSGGASAQDPSLGTGVSSGPNGLRANVSSGSGPLFGLVVLGVMIADTVDYVRGSGRWMRSKQEMAADRKVDIRDCTRPIEYSSGNISCQ
jgi:hypothetical protein